MQSGFPGTRHRELTECPLGAPGVRAVAKSYRETYHSHIVNSQSDSFRTKLLQRFNVLPGGPDMQGCAKLD
jgi:hypothetical protein